MLEYLYSALLLIIGSDKWTKFLIIFGVLWFIISLIISKVTKNSSNKRLIKKCVGVIPLLLCIIYVFMNLHSSTYSHFISKRGLLCLVLFIESILMFIPKNESDKKISFISVSRCLFIIVGFIVFVMFMINLAGYDQYLTDYSSLGWTDSFSHMVDTMSESYVSRNYKQIDFEGLRNRFIPLVQEAERINDKKLFAKALLEYRYEFFDQHIRLVDNTGLMSQAEEELVGNDYGISMYKLSNGDTIAIMVEDGSQASKYGIHDGTVIKKWDGVDVDIAMEDVRCLDMKYQFEVLENEKFMKPIFLAGQGGEKVSVTFIADDGSVKDVFLDSMGSYKSRELDVLEHFYSVNRLSNDNFSYKMLNDDVGYLRITEEYSGGLSDYSFKNRQVYEDTDKKLRELSDSGMKYLVIDIRNNHGGYETISDAVASLFADRRLSNKIGVEINGKNVPLVSYSTFDEGKWKDLPVVVLVNDVTVSSGDVLTHLLSQCPNVTVMGITSSSNSVQTVGGHSLLSDDMFEIYYPLILSFDENDDIIEVTADRQAKVGFDLRIPVDYDGAMKIFSDTSDDYEIDYAIEYLYSH